MSQQLGTLVKAMDVLDALGDAAPIGVVELSRRLGMDKSAVSRILTTFKSHGYVKVLENGHYDIGLRVFELGQAVQKRMPVRETLIPHVDAIARETGETAFAFHYTQGQVAGLYDCVSTQDIHLGERYGLRVSPWNHPAGKAILAHRNEDDVIEGLAFARRTRRKGLPTIESFRRELALIRRQGYVEQRDTDKCLLSAPIYNDITGRVNAALMVGGPVSRLPTARSKAVAELLIQHAAEVSLSLGWVSASPSR